MAKRKKRVKPVPAEGGRVCVQCGKDLRPEAGFCGECGAVVAGGGGDHPGAVPAAAIEAAPAGAAGEKITFSNVLPLWQFIALSFFTFGFYSLYWFYRNWKHFKKHKNLDISPGWRTVILFIPIIGLIYIYKQLEDIRTYGMEAGVKDNFLPGVVILFQIVFNLMWKLPEPYQLIALFSFVPYIFVQLTLNEYWKIEQPGMPVKESLSGWQFSILAVGVIWMFLVFVGLLLPKTAE